MPYNFIISILVITCHVLKKYTSMKTPECEQAHIYYSKHYF